ncbi:hypothetical protein [Sporolactobacillus terrae]|uniref:hypothetical protein n=1 Tax=Sporolactobacillus terrae TaxID=269673 RepID=UPI00048F865C|nr:hypothetical protein [Sporolactobacillus terrae]
MKKICLLFIGLVILLLGCTQAHPTKDLPHQVKKVNVMIHIDDHTGRFHYFGISINKTHPDPNTLMYYRINWIKKTTESFLLDKESEYRIDLSASVNNPIQAMKKKHKETANHHAPAETKQDLPIRKYITPTKNNQVVRFTIDESE